MWQQYQITLTPKSRGFHLITQELTQSLHDLKKINRGLAHFFIQHTSASLCINENADPDVRTDLEAHFNHFVPENAHYYRHILEGSDDMPAHIKAITVGSSLNIPIQRGKLALGTWQGIYLGEHRNHAGSRSVVVTLQGER